MTDEREILEALQRELDLLMIDDKATMGRRVERIRNALAVVISIMRQRVDKD
jgi:3-phenylpropionate/cinnamic acid dioxygenase small subunit